MAQNPAVKAAKAKAAKNKRKMRGKGKKVVGLGKKGSRAAVSASKLKKQGSIGKQKGKPQATSPSKIKMSPTLKKTRTPASDKRVSFAQKLTESQLLDELELDSSALSEEAAQKTPLRSILKKKEQKKLEKEPQTPPEQLEAFEEKPLNAKKRRSLVVSKKVKQKLLEMDRKERKLFLKELREKRKPYAEIAVKAKQLWEKVRSGKTSANTKEKLINELRALVRGKVRYLVYAHDTVRVVECLMALNRKDIRAELFQEVKTEIRRMSTSKYAKFFVLKMIKYGTKEQREYIMDSFRGKVPELLKSSVGAEVVESAFNDHANALQRARILSEFYGAEFSVFQMDKPTSLEELLATDPLKKPLVLRNLRQHLMSIASKAALRHSLTHRLLLDYLTLADADARSEMVDALKERVPEIVHTKDGVKAAMHCVWWGSAKERKTILKTLKGVVVKLCKEEAGHLLLLAIFDSVDDTVLVDKLILKEMAQSLDDVARDKFGSRVLLYLTKPRDPRFFLKETIELLAKGDANPASKKESIQRHKELLSSVSVTLLHYIKSNVPEFAFDVQKSLLALNILQYVTEEAVCESVLESVSSARRCCFESLASLCGAEFVPCDVENRLHLVEHPQGSFLLSQLLLADKKQTDKDLPTLSHTLATQLSPGTLAAWTACNRGAFTLLHMWESGVPESQRVVESVVRTEARNNLHKYSFKAAKLLLDKVK